MRLNEFIKPSLELDILKEFGLILGEMVFIIYKLYLQGKCKCKLEVIKNLSFMFFSYDP